MILNIFMKTAKETKDCLVVCKMIYIVKLKITQQFHCTVGHYT